MRIVPYFVALNHQKTHKDSLREFNFTILLSCIAARQVVWCHDYGSQLDLLHFAQMEAIHGDCERGEYSFLYMEPYAARGYGGG